MAYWGGGAVARQTTKTTRDVLKYLKQSTKRINQSTFFEQMKILLTSVYHYKRKGLILYQKPVGKAAILTRLV